MKMREPEDFVASLDIGSDKMVMALGKKSEGYCRLVGVESIESAGVERGRIVDKAEVQARVRRLLEQFKEVHGFEIDSLNVSLPGNMLRREERRERFLYSRTQVIEGRDLNVLMKRCKDAAAKEKNEIVEILPTWFKVEDKICGNPVGMTAKRLEACYWVYGASLSSLEDVRAMLAGVGIQEVEFYTLAGVFQAAMKEKGVDSGNFAVLDLGADHVQVTVLANGLVAHDVELPLGCRTIDRDIDTAFSIHDVKKARALKEEYGEALRAACRSRKVMIPDTKFSIECHDLSYVEQCRLEELLEGAIFQIQQSGYYEELDGGVFLTGGGSRTNGIDSLLRFLSGLQVRQGRVMNMHAQEASKLSDPTLTVALGLLMCGHPVEEKQSKLKEVWGRWFKG